MATPRSTPDPFDSVRDAFADLGTSEKAAFVLEATFETIGQALAETGRRAAAVVDDLDIDSWFRAPRADFNAPPDPPAAPSSPNAPAVQKPAPSEPSPKKPTADQPPTKTTSKPKRRPPADDES